MEIHEFAEYFSAQVLFKTEALSTRSPRSAPLRERPKPSILNAGQNCIFFGVADALSPSFF